MRLTLSHLRALLVGATVTGASAALAQDEWTRQVDARFEEAAPMVQEKGLIPRGTRRYGSLADDASERFAVAADSSTLFLGLCDDDCTDLDLVLIDGAGAVVDSDQLPDDYPIVTAQTPGSYMIEVRMAACRAAPCRYGVQAYTR